MLDKFWEEAGGKLADRWASVSTPALVFWLGGLLAWISGASGLTGLRRAADWAGRQSVPTQVVVIIAALAGVAASGVIVRRLAAPALRMIEGYWPGVFGGLARWRAKTVAEHVKDLDNRFQELAGPVLETKDATFEQRAEFVQIDRRLRRLPADGDYLPTRTGNILRAGERRPKDKYGLDAVTLWPRLWLLLAADTRRELAAARSGLDDAVATMLWGLLFTTFGALAWWAVPVGVAVAVVMYLYWIPNRAEVFADLLEAAFDLYRRLLYEQLRWPLPARPHDEHDAGEQLTSYLVRGSDAVTPVFTPSEADPGQS
jgi:hypothetical protein